MDSKNLAIGVLSTTAVILLVGVLIIGTRTDPALASGMSATGGTYSVIVGKLNTTEEIVYVIDASTETLVSFTFDSARKSIQPIQRLSLKELRQATSSSQGQQPATPKRGGRTRTRPPRRP